MKRLFLSKKAIISVDILLAAGFIALLTCAHEASDSLWTSTHCIAGVAWFLIVNIHVAQHWRMIKSFTRKKVIFKNKITALTIFAFILMFLSITSMIAGFNTFLLGFHHVAGLFFALIFFIHTINKSKRFLSLFRKKQATVN